VKHENNANVKKFLAYVYEQCSKNGIKVDLRDVKSLKLSGNIYCSGYFDEENKIMVVAMKHPQALEVLVHEFGHFTQWVQGIPIWTESGDALGKVDEWLGGKEVRNIETHMGKARDLELDNEKRAVKLIKRFNLPIDIDLYIKKANAYVLFYTWMLTTRKWAKRSNSPYRNKTLIEACSSKFNMRYDQLSPRMRKAFEDSGV
jgi:hypothetical protein